MKLSFLVSLLHQLGPQRTDYHFLERKITILRRRDWHYFGHFQSLSTNQGSLDSSDSVAFTKLPFLVSLQSARATAHGLPVFEAENHRHFEF
jgi:hypothetical protein